VPGQLQPLVGLRMLVRGVNGDLQGTASFEWPKSNWAELGGQPAVLDPQRNVECAVLQADTDLNDRVVLGDLALWSDERRVIGVLA